MITQEEKETIQGKIVSIQDFRIIIMAFSKHKDFEEIIEISIQKCKEIKRNEMREVETGKPPLL